VRRGAAAVRQPVPNPAERAGHTPPGRPYQRHPGAPGTGDRRGGRALSARRAAQIPNQAGSLRIDGVDSRSVEGTIARRRTSRMRVGENVDGYVFIAPWLIGFIGLTAAPMLASIYLALSDWDLLNPVRFIGLNNFPELFKDDLFWLSLYNTGYYTFL